MPAEKRKTKVGTKWRYRGQYKGVSYRSKTIYQSKQEAITEERKHLVQIDEELRRPTNDILLHDLMNARLDELKLRNSKKYFEDNRWYFKFLLKEVGNIPVSEITKLQINTVLNGFSQNLLQRGKTNHKANGMLRAFKSLFNWGMQIHDLDIKNPVYGIKLFSVEIKLKYIPPTEEIESVKINCTPDEVLLIDFVAETGCRIMEAIRFKYEDIEGDLITLWTRKSKNSNFTPRRIPVPDCMKNKRGRGRVFASWDKTPRFLEYKIKESGFRNWNWHNLRHRRASIWANAGMPTFEIMTRLGHSNMSTTMKYLQLLGFTRG